MLSYQEDAGHMSPLSGELGAEGSAYGSPPTFCFVTGQTKKGTTRDTAGARLPVARTLVGKLSLQAESAITSLG